MKKEKLLALAHKRQRNVPHGYKGIGDYHNGAYECEYVSPYTRSANNTNADIMFILQDWCSDELLSQPVNPEIIRLGHMPELPTNKNLKTLLKTHLGTELEDTYGTNLFPFIKPGNISSTIPKNDLTEAAINYAIPQIEAISPKIVICLGVAVFNAIRNGLELPQVKNLEAAIATPFQFRESIVWAQSHPGGLGRAGRNRGGVDRVSADWAVMAEAVHE